MVPFAPHRTCMLEPAAVEKLPGKELEKNMCWPCIVVVFKLALLASERLVGVQG